VIPVFFEAVTANPGADGSGLIWGRADDSAGAAYVNLPDGDSQISADGSNCRAGRRMPTATTLGLIRYAQFSLGYPPASDPKTLDNWPIRPADSVVLREAPPHRRGFHRPCVVRRVRRSCSPTRCSDLGIMRRAVRARIRLAYHNAK
jgi:hypothetical protein